MKITAANGKEYIIFPIEYGSACLRRINVLVLAKFLAAHGGMSAYERLADTDIVHYGRYYHKIVDNDDLDAYAEEIKDCPQAIQDIKNCPLLPFLDSKVDEDRGDIKPRYSDNDKDSKKTEYFTYRFRSLGYDGDKISKLCSEVREICAKCHSQHTK